MLLVWKRVISGDDLIIFFLSFWWIFCCCVFPFWMFPKISKTKLRHLFSRIELRFIKALE